MRVVWRESRSRFARRNPSRTFSAERNDHRGLSEALISLYRKSCRIPTSRSKTLTDSPVLVTFGTRAVVSRSEDDA